MKLAAVLCGAILAAVPAFSQKVELKFDDIAARAVEKAEVDLDGAMLTTAMQLLGNQKKGDKASQDPKAQALPEFLSGIQEVHVRHYEFDKAGAWSDKDLEGVRKQVSTGAGWSRIASVKEKNESVEVYVLSQGGKLGGALILAGEEKELTVVHVLGTLTLAQMKELVDSKIAYNLGGIDILSALPK
ncbi:MAG: DUF4252 domain-containing protein [Candidatus Solibacter sp.]